MYLLIDSCLQAVQLRKTQHLYTNMILYSNWKISPSALAPHIHYLYPTKENNIPKPYLAMHLQQFASWLSARTIAK
jgi:hypothetical protein